MPDLLVADTIPLSPVDGPGMRFVVFLQGCGFNCIACHNPQTIPDHSPTATTRSVPSLVDQIAEAAPYISGLTVSGGEATRQPEGLTALLTAVRDDPRTSHLTRFVDSNGDAPQSVWDDLGPVMDAAMVDLKVLDDELHRELARADGDRTRASIQQLADAGKLHEVRLLLIPGLNDDLDLLDRTGDWLSAVDPTMRVRILGFRNHGVRRSALALRSPTAEEMSGYAQAVGGGRRLQVSTV